MDGQKFPRLPDCADIYLLLALGVKHGGRFATFDQSLDAPLIPGGPGAHFIIPSP